MQVSVLMLLSVKWSRDTDGSRFKLQARVDAFSKTVISHPSFKACLSKSIALATEESVNHLLDKTVLCTV